MTLNQFIASLSENTPEKNLPPLLKALWYDGKGDWDKAHSIADGFGHPDGDWIHAYLHRKEGDQWNANYWYRKAGRSMPDCTLKEEWQSIVQTILHKHF